MNYRSIYDSIVCNAKIRGTPNGYYESHHILPRSLGGSDAPENLVNVSAREHFILHYLLTKFTDGGHRRKMLHAFMLMAGSNENQDRYMNSRLYESKKSEFAEAQRQRFTGVLKTEQHKQNISKALTGRVTSDETKKKQSDSASKRKRKPFSPEYRAAMSARMKEVKATKH
ncbi:putative homing endonuclease [Pseudomonas phage vB_PF_Y1-MI]|nr:putative homing endonuclease [Pseudomonas phage vB_PF_Y1-MI]